MEDPAARKARLQALKREAAAAAAASAGQAAPGEAPSAEPVLKFRNYQVHDQKHVQHQQIAPAQPPKLEEPVVVKKPEDAAQEELLVNVAPKKANWDLKRDVQPKLDKLERRTARAILEIMRDQEREAAMAEDGQTEQG